jgi:uncharacterized protein YigE (DUF2233 family)
MTKPDAAMRRACGSASVMLWLLARAGLVAASMLAAISAGRAQRPIKQPAAADLAGICRSVAHEDVRYTVCTADPAKHTIRLAWNKPDGQPYGVLSALPKVDAKSGRRLALATNAGMFDPSFKPVGLYVENGRRLVAANTRAGKGNFHLRPNGIFYVAGGRAGILETRAYIASRPRAEFATQSGPMLVIGGKLHPLFVRAGKSRKMRDGVGVSRAGKVVIAISETPVTFAQFGRLYRDALDCPDALFLDGGSVPALYAPHLGRGGNLLPMGPMLAVYVH